MKIKWLYALLPLCFVLFFLFSEKGAKAITIEELKVAYETYVKTNNRDSLAPYEGRKICLIGFPHQKNDGSWILTSSPETKSCCLGAKNKQSEQVAIAYDLGPWAPFYRPVKLSGFLQLIEKEGRSFEYKLFDISLIP